MLNFGVVELTFGYAVEAIKQLHQSLDYYRKPKLQLIKTLIMTKLIPFLALVPLLGKATPPNIIIVFPDQMRGSAMGFLGEEPVQTPHLDRFATSSVVFNQAVSNYPVSSPTRAMLMTGQYAFTNHVPYNINSNTTKYNCELQEKAVTWSDVLAENGYALGYIGKWHLDSPRPPYVESGNNTPEMSWNEWCEPERRHGFSYWHAYGTYDAHLKPMYWDTKTPRDSAFYVDKWGPEYEIDKAIEFIGNRNHNQPFGLVVSMNPPHTDYHQVPQRYKDLYENIPLEQLTQRPNIPPVGTKWGDHYRKHIKAYYACVTGVDDQFGRLLRYLDQQGLTDNTIILFFSDHGDCIGIHNEITKNNPYEESMRVPFLIKWGTKLKPQQTDYLVSIPDIYPSLLEMAGLKSQIPLAVEGRSFAPFISGKSKNKPDNQIYLRLPYGKPHNGLRGIRTQQYTYVIEADGEKLTPLYLFDRIKDPFQLHNVLTEQPKVEQFLHQEMIQELKQIHDPLFER